MSERVALKVEQVTKRFGGVAALAGISMQVDRGSIAGLIGPNGAGKSTLFNVVSGVVPADSGRIELFGADTTACSSHQIARLGMVRTFQLARELGRLTVLENIMVAAPDHPGERLARVFLGRDAVARHEDRVFARALELLDLVGLRAVMDQRADAISGGQKKLLELARALMLDPELILLDEPAAGVNPALMQTLGDVIVQINREFGKTFLIVEHDMGLVSRLCTTVTVMAAGQHLVSGDFAAIAKDPRVIEAYLGGHDGQ